MYPDFEPYRAYLKQRRGIASSDDLTRDLLHSRQVATLPGTAFGDAPEALRPRLSTGDFDGLTALSSYEEIVMGSAGDRRVRENKFVETACPRVAEGCRRLVQYFTGEE